MQKKLQNKHIMNGGLPMKNLVEKVNEELAKDVLIKEISVEDIESLEETVTPGVGVVCGNSCWGVVCW